MAGIGDVLAGLGAVVGVRSAPEPPHDVVARLGPGLEVRRYAARTAYEAPMPSRDPGRAFGRLFRTIAGGNAAAAKIAMTAPIETGPRGEGWAMRFFLPETMAAGTAPRPDDPGLRLVQLPATTYAVRRFAGSASLERLAAEEVALRRALEGSGWRAGGPALTWLYDPPFTPSPLRRNEVAIEVARG